MIPVEHEGGNDLAGAGESEWFGGELAVAIAQEEAGPWEEDFRETVVVEIVGEHGVAEPSLT